VNVAYPGPVRREPLAVEFHNTLYVHHGKLHDGLETTDGLRGWLAAVADRLPAQAQDADGSRHGEFLALRAAVADALHAALEEERVPASAAEALNAVAAAAPFSPVAVVSSDGQLSAETRYHSADATDIALATIAADAIELLTGPRRTDVHACRAPGCILLFLRDNPRRRWCSEVCGNRARQARHYERARHQRRVSQESA
jgi:predicted RNA-binding Zn ribbon-like protein